MGPKTLTIEISPELEAVLGSDSEAKQEIHQALVMDLLRQGKLSRGKAAELLHIPIREFPSFLAKYHIPWIDWTTQDGEEDRRTLRNQGSPSP